MCWQVFRGHFIQQFVSVVTLLIFSLSPQSALADECEEYDECNWSNCTDCSHMSDWINSDPCCRSEDLPECYPSNCCWYTEGIYIQLFVGPAWGNDVIGSVSSLGEIIEAELRTGYWAGGALGWRWCNGLRLEAEVSYRDTNINTTNYFSGGINALSTEFSELIFVSYMANLLYEGCFDICGYYFRPFAGFGLGAGYARLEIRDSAPTVSIDDGCSVFAYQWIFGLAHPINDCLDLGVEYRLFGTSGLDIFELGGGGRFESKNDFKIHSILFSAKWVYGRAYPI